MLLYKETNYSAGIHYLTNTFITEYDISKANINILYSKGLLDKETYDYLYNAERMVRQVYIGKLRKTNSMYTTALKQGITEAKELLFKSNDIKDHEVLSIKNDAVYVIGRKLANTEFGLVKFADKNQYTSFMSFMNMELYYYYNPMTQDEILDIKGIKRSKVKLHENHMYQFLKDVFFLLQTSNVTNAIDMVRDFYMDYITFNLPVNYYRKFSIDSNFHYKASPFMNTGFDAVTVEENDKMNLDITYNLELLRNIQKILISIAM
jgi:hypothetical protein